MKILSKIFSGLLIVTFSLNLSAMMQELSSAQVANDTAIGIPALSQALQNINLREYSGQGTLEDNKIKAGFSHNGKTYLGWYDVIERVETMLKADNNTYKDLVPLFNNMKDLSNQLFDAAMTGNLDFKEKKAAVDKLSKKQSEVKRFLLGQKAKSFFSFGKKQDEYKNMRQLLLGMIDMLNGKIELMKKSVK